MKASERLIESLLEIKAVKLQAKDPFTWASGMRSPIYCDNRISLSYPEVRNHIKNMFISLCLDLEEFDSIVGVATAGIPHGAILADALDKPFSYVRAKAKAHGRKNQIEGRLESGQRVVVVEDLVSTGMSSLEAVDVLQKNDINVIATIAIFTYGFKIAEENFRVANIPLYTLTNYGELIKRAIDSNYITKEEGKVLSEWNKNPKEWFSNNFNT